MAKTEEQERERTIPKLLEELADVVCSQLCKYAASYPEEDQDFLIEEICTKCPMGKYI